MEFESIEVDKNLSDRIKDFSQEETDLHQVSLFKLALDRDPKKKTTSYRIKQPTRSNGLSVLPHSITDLPAALISEILNCLDPKELGIVSCTSTVLHNVASALQVWQKFYNERWGLPLAPTPPLNAGFTSSYDKSWKELFVERELRSKIYLGRYSTDFLYGHAESVHTVFLLASVKLVFTSGHDSVVRMWDIEEGFSIASSRPLGCTIRAVSADTKLLIAGGTEGFIHCWKAVDGLKHLFDLRGLEEHNSEFRLWEHEGPITCLALDLTKLYSGSWDMSVRVWDRASLKCVMVLRHGDWVWSMVVNDSTVASASGSDLYVWDTKKGIPLGVVYNANVGNVYSLAQSHTGDFLFTGGEDGAIHMFEITSWHDIAVIATWIPHTGPVYSLAFEFPWLVSASGDGKLSLINVRELVRRRRRRRFLKHSDGNSLEAPRRMLHAPGSNFFSVDIGVDRIICGGEEGVVRIWNFSHALEIEERVRALRGRRLENRMRRRKLKIDMSNKGGQSDPCSVAAAKKNSVHGDKGVWHSKRGMSGKLKA